MSMEIFQSQMEDEVRNLNALQKDMKKLVESRQKLLEQQSESALVKKEADLLEKNAKVYKLIGPALIRQEVSEVKANVAKRLDFIDSEAKKVEYLLKDNEQKQIASRTKMNKIRENFQKLLQEKQQGK